MTNKDYCVKCKTTIALSDRPYTTIKDKGYYFCKSCRNERQKGYYDKTKMLVFDHYGNKCACCAETNFLFLTIDHINNDGNVHRHPNGQKISGVLLYSKIKNAGFPDTYQILCMNCNFGKRMNNGICPHNANVV